MFSSRSTPTRTVIRLCISVATLVMAGASGGAARTPPISLQTVTPSTAQSLDQGRIETPLRATALVDTTLLGAWTFDSGGGCTAEGWVSVDMTAQNGDYMHVDDFAGLGGGSKGLLTALEGNQSMWCGVRPDALDPELCGYLALPGYGNRWNQALCTACVAVTGRVAIDYLIAYDTEPGYDFVRLEWDPCDDTWSRQLWIADETLPGTFQSDTISAGSLAGSVRLRFRFTSDPSWSDYDGLWNTDGAFILDSLTVSDGGGVVLATELFEGESVGDHATLSGNWQSCPVPGYGDFAGLFAGGDVLQNKSDCVTNTSCLWGFFAASTANYACGGFPGQAAVPYGNDRDQYLTNEIWSPWVPLAGSGDRVELACDVYLDLPLDNLIFWVWRARSRDGGCASVWASDFNVYFTGSGWQREVERLDPFVDPSAAEIQVSLGAVDLCGFWCGVVGTGACHSHAPLFDNVEVRRLETTSPSWSVQWMDLFQDNFPGDGTTTGTVRADIARDIHSWSVPTVRPGDSCAVSVSYPGDGLATDPHTGIGAAVYAYVGVWPQGQVGKSGAALSGDISRWPAVDSMVHGGDTWYCLRMDTVFTGPGVPGPPNQFCVDLNDNLFTPGDTVCFVFSATSGAPSNATSYWTEFTGETTNLSLALDNAMEFTCLPTPAAGPGYRVLYVDAADGYGAQPAFDAAFDALGIAARVDRYDQRAPASGENNGLASRVASPIYQVARVYDIIVWSSGRVSPGLGDGVNSKSDDASLLAAFMDDRCTGGIYFTGDDIAMAISQAAAPGGPALRAYIDFTLAGGNHVTLGHDVSPLVVATPGSCFDRVPDDTLVAYGGCPVLRDFDVITPGGPAALEASYTSGALTGAAVVSQQQVNPGCGWTGPPQRQGVILAGFGFETIQNNAPSAPSDAVAHMDDVLSWLLDTPTGIASSAPARNALGQNYPNPFNPSTTIRYQVRERGPVTLVIYNVAGQRVRTLVDGTVAAGVVHTVGWDGRDDRGQSVASGVYFCRLVTTGFDRTRKMVLLR